MNDLFVFLLCGVLMVGAVFVAGVALVRRFSRNNKLAQGTPASSSTVAGVEINPLTGGAVLGGGTVDVMGNTGYDVRNTH